jgi:RNA polymerase sigma-70 factor (ECF subfamily)
MLSDISSHWPLISDPLQFVMRYAPAIQAYLGALVKGPHDREEVLQDFLARVVERGFVPQQVTRGRFRDYLKAAVRNAALAHLRRRVVPQADEAQLAALTTEGPAEQCDREWLGRCRQAVLAQGLDRLEEHERQSPEGRLFTVLKMTLDAPDADSADLAARTADHTGRPMSPAAFRKQLSRARERFAALLIDEVRQTLHAPTAEAVEEELGELGLLEHVRPYLGAG